MKEKKRERGEKGMADKGDRSRSWRCNARSARGQLHLTTVPSQCKDKRVAPTIFRHAMQHLCNYTACVREADINIHMRKRMLFEERVPCKDDDVAPTVLVRACVHACMRTCV